MVDKSFAEMCLHDIIVSLRHGHPQDVQRLAVDMLAYLKKPEHVMPNLTQLAELTREEFTDLMRHMAY